MKVKVLIVVCHLIILGACSVNEPDRSDLIEEQLNIELPEEFETLENKYTTLEFIPSEYQIQILLEFDQNGIHELEDQIKSTEYYNELRKYIRSSNLTSYNQEEIEELEDIKRTLSMTGNNGSWVKSKTGYMYVDILGADNGEPVKASLNLKKKSLLFDYMNI